MMDVLGNKMALAFLIITFFIFDFEFYFVPHHTGSVIWKEDINEMLINFSL